MTTTKQYDLLNRLMSMVAGNTLTGSGHGIMFYEHCTNAVILKNDFGAATHRGIAWDGASGFLQHATIAKNVLGQGNSYHLKLRHPDSFNYFLMHNTYKNGASTNAPFIDAANSPVHFFY
jgi:hypothetical protein